ncbi:helix-turn-helix domain-containing protein [Flavobacterium quisquiliarum]|uniref:Helix-turn-helix domain-containing protein n=1 Tax=Flavobacterium quisquiliarum TaxID=1834436 RepID=A0ABV8W3S5_9FLAO|nr:AraC family transcriptional regulator [Flavobacterium quisquiliarum]MBW1655379.1 helix-turn-helix domain-containing protein [Flavobacterium quisquiliarum]
MKTIEHFYSADLDWVQNLADQFGGEVKESFIVIPEDIQTGTRYFLKCDEGIIAYYIDVEYKKELHLIQRNSNPNFVGYYYNLTEGNATVSGPDFMYNVTKWQYNLSVIDGALSSDYHVTRGSKTFALCIFIRKDIIESFAIKNNIFLPDIDKIINPKLNTIVRFDRMSDDSLHILDDLRKVKVGGPIFDLYLTGSVHMLIANYLKKIATKRIIIQTVNQQDLATIISIQMYLTAHLEDHFPSIKQLANKANMSESKFKSLFTKITGNTPNVYFVENKLLLAKELLEAKELSISQIADKLHFTNNSYFASKFKEYFGLSPKAFVKEL